MRRFALLGIVCAIAISVILVGSTDSVSAKETLVVEPNSHVDKRLELTAFGAYQYSIDFFSAQGDSSSYILTMDDVNYHLFIAGQPYVTSGYQAVGSGGTGSSTIWSGPQVVYLVFVNNAGAPIEVVFEGSFHPFIETEFALFVAAIAIAGFVVWSVRRDTKGPTERPNDYGDPYLASFKVKNMFKGPRQLTYLALFLVIMFSYSVTIFLPVNGLSVLELLVHSSPGILALIAATAFSFIAGLFILKRTAIDQATRAEGGSLVIQLVRVTLAIEGALTIYKLLFPSAILVEVTGSTGVSALFVITVLAFSALLFLGAALIGRPGMGPLVLVAVIAALLVNPVLGVPAALAFVYTDLPWKLKMGRGTAT